MNLLHHISLILLVLSLPADDVGDGKKANLKPYYFPYAELTEAHIYKYLTVDSAGNESFFYWHMQTIIEGSDTLLTSITFSQNLYEIETFTEIIKTDGCHVNFFAMSDPEEIADIIHSEVYAWKMSPGQSISYEVDFKPDIAKVIKTRTFKGIENDRAHFHDVINSRPLYEGGTASSWTTDSYYEKGTGLVEFIEHYPGSERHYKLDATYTEAEWQQILDAQ